MEIVSLAQPTLFHLKRRFVMVKTTTVTYKWMKGFSTVVENVALLTVNAVMVKTMIVIMP